MAAGSSTLPNETVTLRLPTGEEVDGIIPGGLSDDQAKSYMQMKRPDVFGPPAGIKAPQQQPMQQVDITGKSQNPQAQFAGLPGAWGNRPVQGKDLIPGSIAGGAAAAVASPTLAAGTLPFVRQFAAKHPVVTMMAAQEGIHQLRQTPGVGRFIPSAAEWLPFLMGGGKEAAKGEAEPPPSTDQLPGRPYMPNPRFEPQPEPEPLPPRNGPLLLKGEVQQSTAPTNYKKLPWMPNLEKALGNKPGAIKPGVPIRQQQIAQPMRESSAVQDYGYDEAAKEFHVTPKGGNTTYIYGDVPPEQAQAFDQAESKGQAWQQMRSNTLVGKVVNGKRVDIKPTAPSSYDPNNLTDILTRSVRAAKQGTLAQQSQGQQNSPSK